MPWQTPSEVFFDYFQDYGRPVLTIIIVVGAVVWMFGEQWGWSRRFVFGVVGTAVLLTLGGFCVPIVHFFAS